jgi:hypothetical protein
MATEHVTAITASEIPVDGVTAIDGRGKRIALANVGGTYYAFDDACAHSTNEARLSAVTAREEAHRRFRLLATMVQGTAAALPEAWQPYRTIDEARAGAREMLHNHRVLRVAIVEDRIPPQFVEWVGR